MAKKPRFPDIIWYCDHCGALLSSQSGFDDHKYTWKCKKCGYKNSISWDNINPGDSLGTRLLLVFLGLLSFIGFWTSIMLAISMFAFSADKNTYIMPFFIFLGLYLFVFAVLLIVEFGIRHTVFSTRNLFIVILRNLKEDLLAPFMVVKEVLSDLLSMITRLLPIKRKHVRHSNIKIVVLSIIYILLIAAEIVAFNKINHFGASNWWNLILNGYTKIRGLISNF